MLACEFGFAFERFVVGKKCYRVVALNGGPGFIDIKKGLSLGEGGQSEGGKDQETEKFFHR